MSVAHLFTNFNSDRPDESAIHALTDDELEDFRLAAFEQGFSAGWDDSIAAQEQEKVRISKELAARLADLSFTYEEAVVKLTVSIAPVFELLVENVLPQVMVQTFSDRILERLNQLTREILDQPVVISVPAAARPVVARMVEGQSALSVSVVEDASLSDGQANLRIGTSEELIDGEALIAEITELIEAFYFHTNEDLAHG